jgi:glutamine synthetase
LLTGLLEFDDRAGHSLSYSERGSQQAQTPSLPRNLLDAIRAFEQSQELRKHSGSAFIEAYPKIKTVEWGRFHAHLSAWEREVSIDC